jgi:hypothetical protein
LNMADPFKNLQAAARCRGQSLRKDGEGFALIERRGGKVRAKGTRMEFEDLGEVRDELRARPIETWRRANTPIRQMKESPGIFICLGPGLLTFSFRTHAAETLRTGQRISPKPSRRSQPGEAAFVFGGLSAERSKLTNL